MCACSCVRQTRMPVCNTSSEGAGWDRSHSTGAWLLREASLPWRLLLLRFSPAHSGFIGAQCQLVLRLGFCVCLFVYTNTVHIRSDVSCHATSSVRMRSWNWSFNDHSASGCSGYCEHTIKKTSKINESPTVRLLSEGKQQLQGEWMSPSGDSHPTDKSQLIHAWTPTWLIVCSISLTMWLFC